MGYYPIVLELAGRRCLVIGGGPVAERKVAALLEASASIAVVSPSLTATLATWVEQGWIRHESRPYRPDDLAGADLAFVASDDAALSAAVAREGRRRGVWVNAADDPAHCDFILPSVLRRGALTVAVSTGGASPALARAIREDLETYLTADYAALTEVAAEVRRELRARSCPAAGDRWRGVFDDTLRRLVAAGEWGEARRLLLARLGAG